MNGHAFCPFMGRPWNEAQGPPAANHAKTLILGPSPPTVSFDSDTLLRLSNSYAFLISQLRSPPSKEPSLTNPDSHIPGQKPLLYALFETVLILCTGLCLVTQVCPTLYDPRDCSLTGSSAMGILQARILERAARASSRGIFPAQGSNPGLLHCRQILYQLSHQGNHCIVSFCKCKCPNIDLSYYYMCAMQ